MIAEHVAGKAVRDVLFLSTFGIHALPTMFIVAAVVSIAIVPMLSRVLASRGPAQVVRPAESGVDRSSIRYTLRQTPTESTETRRRRPPAGRSYLSVAGKRSRLLRRRYWPDFRQAAPLGRASKPPPGCCER
jgi:hypothetical protein